MSFEWVTPRLVLRPFTAPDIDDLQSMNGDDRVIGMREEVLAVHYGRRMRVFAASRGPAS